ncbi:hypothetical protein ADUPG1_002306, partial [Aduncisulcus paluster]
MVVLTRSQKQLEQQAVTRAEGISTQNSDLEQSKVTETPTTTV